jgi:hypothetical protein
MPAKHGAACPRAAAHPARGFYAIHTMPAAHVALYSSWHVVLPTTHVLAQACALVQCGAMLESMLWCCDAHASCKPEQSEPALQLAYWRVAAMSARQTVAKHACAVQPAVLQTARMHDGHAMKANQLAASVCSATGLRAVHASSISASSSAHESAVYIDCWMGKLGAHIDPIKKWPHEEQSAPD